MDVSEAKRLKQLEDENTKLEQLLAEQVFEPRRVSRRLFRLGHAAMAGSLSMA